MGIAGDSVAFGSHSDTRFGNIIQEAVDCEQQNVSAWGATMSKHGDQPICEQVKKLKDCDFVIVQGTDDDWIVNKPLDEFRAAVEQVIDTVKRNNPQCKLIMMGATQQHVGERTQNTPNKIGKTLVDYMKVEEAVCREKGVVYLDMIEDSSLGIINESFKKQYMPDGVHPNEKGHALLANLLAKTYYEQFEK